MSLEFSEAVKQVMSHSNKGLSSCVSEAQPKRIVLAGLTDKRALVRKGGRDVPVQQGILTGDTNRGSGVTCPQGNKRAAHLQSSITSGTVVLNPQA